MPQDGPADASPDTANRLSVACLCAAWCRTCDDYRPTLDSVVAEFAARGLVAPARWIDIEDEADLLDDFDVETFPTLLVIDGRQLLFAGPLTPQPETLRRLLASLAANRTPAGLLPAGAAALAARLDDQRRAR